LLRWVSLCAKAKNNSQADMINDSISDFNRRK